MKLLTNEEFLNMQLSLCLLRESYALCMVKIVDFTEYGSVSFWLKVRDYWHGKANKLKLELDKIHELRFRFSTEKE